MKQSIHKSIEIRMILLEAQVETVSSYPVGNFTFSSQSDYQIPPEIRDRNPLRVGFKLIVHVYFLS